MIEKGVVMMVGTMVENRCSGRGRVASCTEVWACALLVPNADIIRSSLLAPRLISPPHAQASYNEARRAIVVAVVCSVGSHRCYRRGQGVLAITGLD